VTEQQPELVLAAQFCPEQQHLLLFWFARTGSGRAVLPELAAQFYQISGPGLSSVGCGRDGIGSMV